MTDLPEVRMLQGHDRRVRGGHPWVFANELEMSAEAKALPPGTLVRLQTRDRNPIALAHFNPHSLIAARVLTRDFKRVAIDQAFIERRLARALRIRERLFDEPYYRLVHAEADGLPGLVVDRMGDALVVQLNTAGMAGLEEPLLAALVGLLDPRLVILRGDSRARGLEGLDDDVRVVRGEAPDAPLPVRENGLDFLCDALHGQKTGWFFDQRDNRAFAGKLARGQRVLDLYAYAGSFGLVAAAAGAEEVVLVDSSMPALDLAQAAADRNGLAARCRFEAADAFKALGTMTDAKTKFGLVMGDPPAFAKSRRDVPAALKGYRKLARGLAAVTGEGGFLVISCCSHPVEPDAFANAVGQGLRDAGRPARLLRAAGAGPDHPRHPSLPETAYLKCLAYALD
ncbi:class I SAM-dependent rRNA methyltransferase [Marinivivus vitaminiproducens]|uniref:class I SAM-dependent rRNA methyltransferase n=1 Tax=Marinivivus vitaminiproducens TaxID=3035935 RepID=UPI0027AB4894|nr:class I SAM-dependent rRNA methyltransferase [Geminicoccaceae bacterium SCSIO 64248]